MDELEQPIVLHVTFEKNSLNVIPVECNEPGVVDAFNRAMPVTDLRAAVEERTRRPVQIHFPYAGAQTDAPEYSEAA